METNNYHHFSELLVCSIELVFERQIQLKFGISQFKWKLKICCFDDGISISLDSGPGDTNRIVWCITVFNVLDDSVKRIKIRTRVHKHIYTENPMEQSAWNNDPHNVSFVS